MTEEGREAQLLNSDHFPLGLYTLSHFFFVLSSRDYTLPAGAHAIFLSTFLFRSSSSSVFEHIQYTHTHWTSGSFPLRLGLIYSLFNGQVSSLVLISMRYDLFIFTHFAFSNHRCCKELGKCLCKKNHWQRDVIANGKLWSFFIW